MSTPKDIAYRITADPSTAERGFKSAEDSARALERELNRLEAQQRKVNDATGLIGRSMLAGGAAIAAGLALSAKAAVDWETAWTGVTKVVSGTPAQMAALEQQIRGLTQVLPASHDEIAAVAAAAGQLGIKRQDIAQFTKVMVDLGYATNLSAEEAAFSLARLMAIMQTAPSNVDRLGATIVNLGNNFATTEADITEMGLRIAGAGHIIGLSEDQVLAYATALSAVGIEAQAGGTAISRAFIGINQAVLEGGDQLDKFAKVAGVSADQFKHKFQTDAAGAMADFIAGLGRMNKAGGDVFGTLDQLGLSEIRVRDAMLRLAGAGDLLNQALQTADAGWSEDIALQNEVNKRYETTAARLAMAKNSIDDLGISLGQNLLPVLGEGADDIRYFGQFLNDLPGPLKTAAEVLAVLTAGFLIMSGTMLVLVPRIAEYRAAVETVINSQTRLAGAVALANTAMSRTTSFLGGPWGAVIGIAITAITMFGIAHEKAKGQIDEVTNTLNKETGAVTTDTRIWAAHALEQAGALDAAKRMGIGLSELTDAVLKGRDATEMAREANEKMGITLKDPRWQQAVADSGLLARTVEDLHNQIVAGQSAWDNENQAVDANKKSMTDLSPAAQQLATDLGVDAQTADDVTAALKDLDDSLHAVFDSIFGLSNAQDDLQDAMDKLTKGIQDQREAGDANAGSFVGMSQAARDNRDALQEVLEKQLKVVEATIQQSGSTADAHKAVDDFKATMEALAAQLGINIDDVDGYNEAVDAIDREIDVKFNVNVGQAQSQVQGFQNWLNNNPLQAQLQYGTTINQRGPTAFAEGGEVKNGPSGHDKVSARLTLGEFVVNREAAQANLPLLEAINNGAVRSFVQGAGQVASRSAAPSGSSTAAGTTVYIGDVTLSVDDVRRIHDIDGFLSMLGGLRNYGRRGVQG